MRICLKELREARVWFELRHGFDSDLAIHELARERDELTAIFVTSINTARRALTAEPH
jgi:hypothetical protein